VKISALYHDFFSGIMGNLSSTIEKLFGNLSKNLSKRVCLYFKWL